MASEKYGRRHRKQREADAVIVNEGRAYCAEVVCLEERDGGTRWIAPGSRWASAHDPTGSHYIGISHGRCNESEAATRGNKARATILRTWDL